MHKRIVFVLVLGAAGAGGFIGCAAHRRAAEAARVERAQADQEAYREWFYRGWCECPEEMSDCGLHSKSGWCPYLDRIIAHGISH